MVIFAIVISRSLAVNAYKVICTETVQTHNTSCNMRNVDYAKIDTIALIVQCIFPCSSFFLPYYPELVSIKEVFLDLNIKNKNNAKPMIIE